MDPSERNTKANASTNDSEKSKLVTPHSDSGETNDPSTNSSYSSPNPSAPLLPSSPYDLTVPDMEPPSYSSVVAQDSKRWENLRASIFNKARPCPVHINGDNSTSGLDNQPPYPTGDETLAIPMPMPIDTENKISVTATVTKEPKSANFGFPAGGDRSPLTDTDRGSMNDTTEVDVPTKLFEHSTFIPELDHEPPDEVVRQQPGTRWKSALTSLECFQCYLTCFVCCVEVLSGLG